MRLSTGLIGFSVGGCTEPRRKWPGTYEEDEILLEDLVLRALVDFVSSEVERALESLLVQDLNGFQGILKSRTYFIYRAVRVMRRCKVRKTKTDV